MQIACSSAGVGEPPMTPPLSSASLCDVSGSAHRRPTFTGIVALAAIVLAGVSVARGVGGGGTPLVACYTRADAPSGNPGSLRAVDDASQCHAEVENSITWNQGGGPGVDGPAGPAGAAGPQ